MTVHPITVRFAASGLTTVLGAVCVYRIGSVP
jgi:hypothetical protein